MFLNEYEDDLVLDENGEFFEEGFLSTQGGMVKDIITMKETRDRFANGGLKNSDSFFSDLKKYINEEWGSDSTPGFTMTNAHVGAMWLYDRTLVDELLKSAKDGETDFKWGGRQIETDYDDLIKLGHTQSGCIRIVDTVASNVKKLRSVYEANKSIHRQNEVVDAIVATAEFIRYCVRNSK